MTLYTPTPTNFYEDYICHFGIKGMKWRHRKGRKLSEKDRGKKKATAEELMRAYDQAKTDEEKKALFVAIMNNLNEYNGERPSMAYSRGRVNYTNKEGVTTPVINASSQRYENIYKRRR